MNNEDKILEILSSLQQDMLGVKQELSKFKHEVSQRFNAVDDQLDAINYTTKLTLEDISNLSQRITTHEKEFHGVG